jgi:hypothetical protein
LDSYDEAVERLREYYQLDLTEVFNSDDLKKAFNNMKNGERPKLKDNLIAGADNFFEANTVQEEVDVNKTNKDIEDIDSVSDVIVIQDFSRVADKERNGKKLRDKFQDKAFEYIPKADTNELKEVSRVRYLVDDRRSFDVKVQQRENELLKENPMSLRRDKLIELGFYGRSLRKVSYSLGLSEDNAKTLFEREGFTVDERGMIKK